MWNILAYVSLGGKNEVQKTYDNGTSELKAQLSVAIEFLRVRAKSEWVRPAAAKLTKCSKFRDFYEIRFFAENKQQRPIGYFGPGKSDFTILIWATEKGGKFIPEGWCEQANTKMGQIVDGKVIPVKLNLTTQITKTDEKQNK